LSAGPCDAQVGWIALFLIYLVGYVKWFHIRPVFFDLSKGGGGVRGGQHQGAGRYGTGCGAAAQP
jgi:hypothetical protein